MKYDVVHVLEEESFSSQREDFQQKIEMAMEANRKVIGSLQNDLKEEGFFDVSTWQHMPQGYASNIVHTIVHLLDGFFGIDSAFYNLLEDSHWVTERIMERIKNDQEIYWLITVHGNSERPDEANRVPFLRPLGQEE